MRWAAFYFAAKTAMGLSFLATAATGLLFVATPATGQPADKMSPAIAAMESGVICAPDIISTRPAPDTIAGTTNVIEEDPPFVSLENRVPAALGIGFGVRAMAESAAGLAPVTIVVTHPPMGAERTTRQSFESSISGIDGSITFYQFDYAYELVTGTWTITAQQAGTTLYRATFEVLAPQSIPELAGVCGFEELLS